MTDESWYGSLDRWKTDAPDPGRADGRPERFKCLSCPWAGSGYSARARHYWATDGAHQIVWGQDPRAKLAPRAAVDTDPALETMASDGTGRR